MRNNCKLLMLVILISACVSQNEADNTDSKLNNYEVIHTFKDEEDSLFANVYAHSVENNIYDSIVITDSNQSFENYLYQIKWNELSNREGIELIGDSDFYGYQLEFEKDYFRIYMLDSSKTYTSDLLIIQWDSSKNQFEVLLR